MVGLSPEYNARRRPPPPPAAAPPPAAPFAVTSPAPASVPLVIKTEPPAPPPSRSGRGPAPLAGIGPPTRTALLTFHLNRPPPRITGALMVSPGRLPPPAPKSA